ncbi:MAG: fibronectin type III domain-containing protein, partial [Acutalibacteraceae bacterium]
AFSLPTLNGFSLTPPVTASAASSKPSKVTGLKVSSGVSSVSLSWKKVSGADGYNICRYDTAKKKYVSVKNVTGTKATVTNLTSATAYRFAVRAYKKSGSKKIYGSFSSQVITATKPQKVTGLKAARTYNTVTLKWDKQKGATSYIVYRYDAAKKKYTTVCKTKEDTAEIKNLKSGTTYYYAVKAYFKSNKVNYYSSLSSKLKVKTLNSSYKITKYHKIVSTGTYLIDGSIKDGDSSALPSTIAVKGTDTAIKTNVDGISMRVVYNGKTKQTYAVVDSMRIYFPMPLDDTDEALDANEISQTYAPSVYGSIKTGTKKIGSKNYSYESFKTLDSSSVTYYFSGSSLSRIDFSTPGETPSQMTVNKFTASVDSSLFTIPKYYLKVDISKLS